FLALTYARGNSPTRRGPGVIRRRYVDHRANTIAPAFAPTARDGVRRSGTRTRCLARTNGGSGSERNDPGRVRRTLAKRFHNAARRPFFRRRQRDPTHHFAQGKRLGMAGGDRAIPRTRAAPALAALSAFREIARGWRADYRVRQTRQIEGFEGSDRACPTAGTGTPSVCRNNAGASRARGCARSGNLH